MNIYYSVDHVSMRYSIRVQDMSNYAVVEKCSFTSFNEFNERLNEVFSKYPDASRCEMRY